MNSSTTTASPAGSTTEQAGFHLARELRRRWRAGARVRAEELLATRPELSDRPEAAVELIYEEYCLREADGDASAEDDLLRRFPQWAAPLRLMLDCHRRVIESGHDRPQFPTVGDRVGDFRLTAELARGSRGRVFLAAQPALADRPVVLKIVPLDGGDGAGEHLSLARLQHTHIVPLYAAFDDPGRGLRVLCMPYFGRATLASLLETLAPLPPAHRTGADVVRAIDAAQGPACDYTTPQESAAPAPGPPDGAARQMLAHVTYARAIAWVAACLADALQFAHERGVVHLDLKPSNVLLAADGQPMLLDFHLARDPVRPRQPLPDHFGGTPPYMPPEQLAAMRALRDGAPAAEAAVDGRADVYALGAMLYESLGGTPPATPASPPLARLNPQASLGLSDVVAKCLAPAPEDRYPTAARLADDLRRHLTDRPLVGVRNRSAAERWSKWRRRRPGALRAAGLLLLAIGAAAALLAGAASDARGRRARADLALADADRQLAAGQFAEAVRTLDRGSGAVEVVPFADALRQRLRDRLATARRLQLAAQLHRLADECRALYAADAIPAGRRAALASQCGAFWADRGAVLDALGPAADPDVSADLQDVAIFAAGLYASGGNGDESLRQALRLLDEAEATLGRSAVVDYERRRYHRTIAGDASPGPRAVPPPSPQPASRRAWDHYALGRACFAAGDVPGATDELLKALRLDPAGRWPNFYYGLCAARAGRHEDAVAAFGVCIGGAPDFAGCYYNRALSYAATGRPGRALADYDRALAIDPAHAAALLNRGILHFQHDRPDAAEADLRRAIAHGADPAAAHYNLALVHLARHDTAAATRDLNAALASNRRHPQARRMMESLSPEPRP